MTPGELKIKVFERALSAAEKQYEENSKIAGFLEDKAQKSATIAGALLAAGLTFIKKETFEPLAARFSTRFVEGLAFLTVALLLITIALCVFVLWLRERPSLPVNDLREMALETDGIPARELDHASYIRYLNDCFGLWPEVLKRQDQINQSKSDVLLWAHLTLSVGFVLIGWLVILSILSMEVKHA